MGESEVDRANHFTVCNHQPVLVFCVVQDKKIIKSRIIISQGRNCYVSVAAATKPYDIPKLSTSQATSIFAVSVCEFGLFPGCELSVSGPVIDNERRLIQVDEFDVGRSLVCERVIRRYPFHYNSVRCRFERDVDGYWVALAGSISFSGRRGRHCCDAVDRRIWRFGLTRAGSVSERGKSHIGVERQSSVCVSGCGGRRPSC